VALLAVIRCASAAAIVASVIGVARIVVETVFASAHPIVIV
jgi:hypothetical protein